MATSQETNMGYDSSHNPPLITAMCVASLTLDYLIQFLFVLSNKNIRQKKLHLPNGENVNVLWFGRWVRVPGSVCMEFASFFSLCAAVHSNKIKLEDTKCPVSVFDFR